MDILEGLNPEQQAAVKHGEGPLLVVAGAGTGKTQVITRRIAYLIEQGRARPGEILALTFTEKAAREMSDRLYQLIGWESFQVGVMTFHAFGAELLARYASHGGRSIRGGLLNDTQKVLLLQQHIERVHLSYYSGQRDLYEFLEGVVAYIGSLQNAGVTVSRYVDYVERLRENPGELHPQDVVEQEDLAALYQLYDALKVETGSFDYDDQLAVPLEILQKRPNLAGRLARQYRFVLVDEYQDTNGIQDALLRTFIPPGGNIFAVGDDDQAIYGFRGARLSNILDFSDYFGVTRPVVLVRNYRSGQAILDASYRLIQHNNPYRLEARLKLDKHLTGQHDKSSLTIRPYLKAADEREGVLREIAERIKAGEEPGSMAVLAATHAPLKAIAKGLQAAGTPFALSSVANIFEQAELIGLWYLLEWIGYRIDEEALIHVVLGPYVGWSPADYRKLLVHSQHNFASLEESLRAANNWTEAQLLVSRLDEWRNWAQNLSVSQLVYKLIFETEVVETWKAEAASSRRILRVFEDVQRFLEQLQDYESVAIDTTLTGYLKVFPRPPLLEVSEPVGDETGVQLLTVHASKGLEFETVYLMGCTQRSWSAGRGTSLEVPEELKTDEELPPEHEFRRLMYVAVTRARKDLIVTAATETKSGSRQQLSPFVTELLEDPGSLPAAVKSGTDSVAALDRLQRIYPLKAKEAETRLPFEGAGGWLELGVNDLGLYEFCPYDFYLEKVLRIRQPLGPQVAFGVALHGVFQAYYEARLRAEAPGEVELLNHLDELWSDRGYERRELAEQAHEMARETVKRFYHREQSLERKIRGVEVKIQLELPEAKLRLSGRIDALLEGPDGLEVRDFKTGRKRDPEKLVAEAKANFQLRTYALALQEVEGQPPAWVTLDYVVTNTEGSAALTPVILKNHRAKLLRMTEAIRAREFTPNASSVHECAAFRYYGTPEEEG